MLSSCDHPMSHYPRDFGWSDARSDALNTAVHRCGGDAELIGGREGVSPDDYQCPPPGKRGAGKTQDAARRIKKHRDWFHSSAVDRLRFSPAGVVVVSILWAVLFGTLIGWVASIVMKTDTSEGILLDIAAGFLGALPLASLLGNNSTFDSVLAGGLGAILALAILHLVRARLKPS